MGLAACGAGVLLPMSSLLASVSPMAGAMAFTEPCGAGRCMPFSRGMGISLRSAEHCNIAGGGFAQGLSA